MRDTFKGNSNDPLLIYAVTRTESKFNKWSYGFGVKTEDKTSAVHMQVKAKLKAGVTDDQVRDAFALAVVGTFGATTNQAYTFISGRDVHEPIYTDYPDQPVQPTLREKQAKLYPIQGSSHTKVVGDTIPNTGNPVADKYITRKGSGDFPAGMNWSWKNNAAPSTANAGKFTYTAVASYQDGSTSEDANSGSDGRVYFTVNPKKPTITTSVVNKKGLANQTIEVNVGSGVKNGSVVKLYDGDRVIGQGTSNGTTARITVSEALPGNPLKAETTVDSGGIVVSEKSDAVTPTEAPDTQAPTLAITPANQTVVEGETVTFTVTARDNKIVNLDAGDFLTKYSSRVFSGTASVTSPTDTDTEKIRRITITTTAEDVGKTNTITFNATDNANHRATPASFTFTVTRRDNTPPTITAGDATVTSREPIPPISVTAVDNTGGVGMRDNNPIEVTGLPSGLTYANNRITGTPTGSPGNSTVTIKAYDKNGNMAPKTITITVRSQADAHNPTGAGLTVNQNYTITDDELRAKVSNYTPGTLSIVSKPSTATAGNAGNAVVKVTYPDGTSDNVDVPVTVTDVTGPTITANDATVTKNEAITAIPVRAVDNTGGVGMRDNNPIEVTNVPAGLTYANNQITGTPTAGIGYYTVTIKAYDKNNRSTTKQIRITVQGQSEKYNPTGTGLTVEQNHTITDDELKAKVSNYAPGTLSIVSRPSTATAGNAGNAVVKVTYSDGTFDNVNVPITVTDVTGPTITAEGTTVTSREQITPISVTAVDNTGGVGMRQNNPIEVTGLPAGLTYANNQITGTPTGPAGNSTVTIKAYDRNNTPTTKEITITVQSQATKYNPTGAGLTVEQNHTITDAELYGKVSNYAPGTLSIVSKPSTTNAGDAGNAVVKVTYPDGTSDNVDVPVTVTDVTGPTITAEEMTVTKNEDITPPIPISAVDNPGGVGMRDTNPITVTNLPSGLTYSNGNITGRTSVRKGYYTLTITAYDKNNRSSTKKVRLNVQEQADKYTPTATELTVNQNEDITIEKLTPKVSNPGAGTLSLVSKPSTTTAGSAGNAVVKVTYSDGSYDSVNVPITVKDVTGPTITANNATVTNREDIIPIPVTAEDNTGGVGMRDTNPIVVTGLPAGLTYANGKITGKPTGTAGESTVTITAYDKNDNPSTTTIKITIQSQADAHNPRGERLTVDKDHPIEDAEVIAKVKDYAPATQLTVKSKPSTATVGDPADAVVTVTYPDGSSEDVNVPVTVRDVLVPDTTGPTITANGATVTKNEPIVPILVTAEDNPGGVGMRDNDPIVVRGLPNGLTFTDGKITGTPTADKGEYSVTIEAFDKINNRSEAPITIKIIVQEQKEKYNPTGEELTVNQGHEITDDEVKAKVKDFGPGTLTVTSKPSTTTAGNAGNAVVTVGYPDGSSDTVNVPVTVKDVTGPTVTVGGATVTKNEPITPIPVTVSDNTGGRGLRDNTPVEVTGLPGGLTYSNGEITGTPTVPKGDYSVTITAYDKDGNPTTETITIKVQEQADKYNPKYGDGKGKPGASVEIPVGEANGKTIPSGTTYTSGTS
ncbi:Rib/alpha-like domain-containing protein, partial [Streptococcus mitis]|uniref:Rib/alpha-like domain-containing protein n=1 Tax=Streptococcus mitis TaxID=28037 RepID=UPI0018C86D52